MPGGVSPQSPASGTTVADGVAAEAPTRSLLGAVSKGEWVVLGAGVLLVSIGFTGTRLWADGGRGAFWDNFHWTAAYFTSMVVSALSARRAQEPVRSLREWFTVAFGALLAGQLSWDVQVAVGWNPFPGPSDVFFLLVAPLVATGLGRRLWRSIARIPARVILDTVGFGFAIVALTLALYLPKGVDTKPLEMLVLVAYPVLFLGAAALMLSIVNEQRERLDAGLLLLFAAWVGHGALWMGWNDLTLQGKLGDGITINYLFSLDVLLLGFASALYEPDTRPLTPAMSRAYSAVSRLMPLLFVLGGAIAVVMAERLAPVSRLGVKLALSGVFITAAVRQLLQLGDAERLLAAEARERRLEQTLVASQRLESLGRLSGGIAHDFNNLLTAILGNAELLAVEGDEKQRKPAMEGLLAAAARARELVRQILAFTRREPADFAPVNASALVGEVQLLLRASIPARHELEVRAEPGQRFVLGNAAQLHQVLVNLATNASHAIGESAGHIVLSARAAVVGEPDLRGLKPGRYVALEVSDDGCGMTEEVRARIFEPFFTTKPPGQGTGLGLSVVHGIVASHGGAIEVDSSPGKGTRVRVLLPATEATTLAPAAFPDAKAPEPPVTGSVGVLVVEDEPAVAAVLGHQLKRLGLSPVVATDYDEALRVFSADPGRFALVITDLSMPGGSGIDLAARLRALAPGVRLVLSSGTSLARAGTSFDAILPKPYGREALHAVVWKVLGRGPLAPSAPTSPSGVVTH